MNNNNNMNTDSDHTNFYHVRCRASTGTEYTYGPVSQIIYAATGTSIDWVYDELNVTQTFVVELPGVRGFILPANEIMPLGRETFIGLKAMWLS